MVDQEWEPPSTKEQIEKVLKDYDIEFLDSLTEFSDRLYDEVCGLESFDLSELANIITDYKLTRKQVYDKTDVAVNEIPQLPQVQYDTASQLRQAADAANKLGLYDAADVIKDCIKR